MKKLCKYCVFYLSTNDKGEEVHERNSDNGYCAIKEGFSFVMQSDQACKDYVADGDGRNE